MNNKKSLYTLCVGLPILLTISACGEKAISYQSSIKPIVDTYCAECHSSPQGEGTKISGFRVDTYEGLMKGTKFGPVIEPGNPIGSSFYRLVSGKVDPSIQMPHGKKALDNKEVKLIEDWIKQGAKNT